jgi:bifunctional non-homologous end joining protein LigD
MKRILLFCLFGCVGIVTAKGETVGDSLQTYKKKRDFSKTKEPAGKKRKSSARPKFVIQQHAARAMHYDVRLEIDGVMVSWAVPKGPSLNPKIKRLAIMTEDHPTGISKL